MTVTATTVAPERTIQALAAELPAALSALRRGIRRTAGGGPLFGSLTGAQGELARLVRHRPGVSVAAAAAELQLSANTVSTLVSQLSEAGVLVRELDTADRRVARLRLTERARTRIHRWRDQQAQQVGAALRRLSARQVRALAAAMPALTALADELAGATEDPS